MLDSLATPGPSMEMTPLVSGTESVFFSLITAVTFFPWTTLLSVCETQDKSGHKTPQLTTGILYG